MEFDRTIEDLDSLETDQLIALMVYLYHELHDEGSAQRVLDYLQLVRLPNEGE